MPEQIIRIVALSGSLRASSTNSTLLRATVELAPADIQIDFVNSIGALPLFNPDLERYLYNHESGEWYASSLSPELEVVRELNSRVKAADGLLVACPEYARGVPGAFKNGLDWLVGGNTFVDKPFAQFNASPRASHAQASLRVTLETMSGWAVEEACIALPLMNRNFDVADIVKDPSLAGPIRGALVAFRSAILAHRKRIE